MTNLQDISVLTIEDAEIAYKLSRHKDYERLHLLLEASAPVFRFTYDRANNDPRPRVLVFGRWQHPTTGNKLVCGLNLNYLDDDEVEQIKKYLPQIMKPDSLKNKYWVGRSLFPDIWRKAWRHYDERYIRAEQQAGLEPETLDYAPVAPPYQAGDETPEKPKETPEEPKETPETPPEAEPKETPEAPSSQVKHALDKLKQLEKAKKGESPKEPGKLGKIAKFAKDTLKRFGSLLKNKLWRNRNRAQAKKELEQLQDLEKEHDSVSNQQSNKLNDLEAEKKAQAQRELQDLERLEAEKELKELEDIENEHEDPQESCLSNLDTLIEAAIEPKKLRWKSPANYIHWHSPEKFFEYQPRLRGCILDYANGTEFHAMFHLGSGKFVVDLVDDPMEILAAANWAWEDVVRIKQSGKRLVMEYDGSLGDEAINEAKSSDGWKVVQVISETAFQ